MMILITDASNCICNSVYCMYEVNSATLASYALLPGWCSTGKFQNIIRSHVVMYDNIHICM